MRARLAFVLLVIGLSLGLNVNPVGARSYYAERFDVVIDIQKNGSFMVSETVVFYFVGGPYTFAFRNLALRELDNIEILEAGMDGKVMTEGIQPGQVEIRRGRDPLEVTWHFLPTADTLHTFTLTYRVEGNVRRVAGLDGLSWRAIPEEHEYDIKAATITVNYPPELAPAGEPDLDGAPYQVEQNPGQIVFNALDIDRDTPLVIDARFPQGSLIQAPPAWQSKMIERSQQSGEGLPYALGAGVAIVGLAFGGLGLFRRQNQSDYPGVIPAGIITSPPDDLSPAQAGMLMTNTQANILHVFATMLDLTRRGWLRMQEKEGRGLFKTRDFIISRANTGETLRLHETVVVDFLFKARGGWREEAKLSEVGQRFNSRLSVFSKALRTELADKNLVDARRVNQRSKLVGWGLLGFLPGVFLAMVGGLSIVTTQQRTIFWGTILLGIGLGLIVAGVVFWIQSTSWSVLSESGNTRVERWSSFRAYLKDLTRSQAELRDEWLDAFLPFAVAFGLGDRWVKAFKDRGLSTTIPWVLSVSGGYADGVVVAAAINSSSAASAAGGGGGGGGGASGAG